MLRISNAGFSSAAHNGWGFLRGQLGVARVVRAPDFAPPLPMLASELSACSAAVERGEACPYRSARRRNAKGSTSGDAVSLLADLEIAEELAGPALIAATADQLRDLRQALTHEVEGGPDRSWAAILRAGHRLCVELETDSASYRAFDDVRAWLEADELERELAFITGLDGRLATLRATVELRGLEWRQTSRAVQRALTVREKQPDGSTSSGVLPDGAPVEDVCAAVYSRLARAAKSRPWAVWIATLAGEAPPTQFESKVSGPFAVCGVPCTGDPGSWFQEARASLVSGFSAAGRPAPPDVEALGEPSYLGDEVLHEARDLWAPLGSPASFVTRVEVSAASEDQARRLAADSLRAIFTRGRDPIEHDVRPDHWVWSRDHGWSRPTWSGQDRMLGAIYAVRTAATAVESWGDDFSAPLVPSTTRALRRRALVASADALPEMRIGQGVTALEELSRPGDPYQLLRDLRIRFALDQAFADLNQLLLATVYETAGTPVASGRTHAELRTTLGRLRSSLEERKLRFNAALFDSIDEALAPAHERSALKCWWRGLNERLASTERLASFRRRHDAAVARLRRHRNMATHGAVVPAWVYAPSTGFVTLSLEIVSDTSRSLDHGAAARDDGLTPMVGGMFETEGDLLEWWDATGDSR